MENLENNVVNEDVETTRGAFLTVGVCKCQKHTEPPPCGM